MSNDALVGYMGAKSVMDKVNGGISDSMQGNSNQIAINEANRIATQAVNKSKASSRTQLILVNGVLDLKKALEQARANTADWKKCAFRERTGKLTWIKTIKDLIKYKHLDKTYEEIRDHSRKYYDANLEDNYKLMDVKGKDNMDIEIKGDFPLL